MNIEQKELTEGEKNMKNMIKILTTFPKQSHILDILMDQENGINELLIGGGAGGSKTFTGCLWLATMCRDYPGTRRGMGRAKLKTLKTTTLMTLTEKVLKPFFGMFEGEDYVITGSNDTTTPNTVVFKNGSQIVLIDLKHYPSLDPDFDDLGSLELTGCFMDEIAQITSKAYTVLNSRTGRWLNDKYNLKKMCLASCNPSKGRPYFYFYKPRKAKKLPRHIEYIQVLATDNIFGEPAYIAGLDNMPEGPLKQRLRRGNRDYGDDTYAVYSRDDLLSMTTNIGVKGEKYLVCDPAGKGKDTTRIYVFDGRKIIDIVIEYKSTPESVKNLMMQKANEYMIKRQNRIYDGAGLGRGLSGLECKVFQGGGSPIEDKRKRKGDQQEGAIKSNYLDLRSQCFFELANPIKEGWISLPKKIPNDLLEEIVEELEVIQWWNIDKDGPSQVIPKDEIKKLIGRSPDNADVFCMRMYFELDKKPLPSFV